MYLDFAFTKHDRESLMFTLKHDTYISDQLTESNINVSRSCIH